MAVYVLSDLHLSFSSQKPMNKFGSRWTNHAEKIKLAWNHTVSDSDTVIICGDISWAMRLEEAKDDLLFLNLLKGKKILLRGNHDYWWSSLAAMKRFLADNLITDIEFLQNDALVCEDLILCGTRGWFCDSGSAPEDTDFEKMEKREAARFELSLGKALELSKLHPEKEIVALTHFPPVFESYIFTELIDLMKKGNIKRCFYGHIHSGYGTSIKNIYDDIEFTLTSCDRINFTPLKIHPSDK